MYTEAQVFAVIKAKHDAGISLRDISADYQNITHADISRILQGEFPRSVCKREALGLPMLLPAPACPKCGGVHVTKRCTDGDKPRKPRRKLEYIDFH
jgi:hypothetical protein